MSSNRVSVVARNVTKTYPLGKIGFPLSLSLRSKRREVEALKPLSMVAQAGDFVGILGKNGSGKSTFMRLIAGSESPTSGSILVSSEPTLLGVSGAFQLHQSGRTNVRIGLLAMGLSRKEAVGMEEEVLLWADLTQAADRPLKTYSSGMRARLSFSIATAVRREILLIDEALSTGDSTFAGQAQERMQSFLDQSGTVFLVSHAPGTVEKHCNRAIWLHEGEIIADGDLSVCEAYRDWSTKVVRKDISGANEVIQTTRADYKHPTIILDSEAAQFLDDF